MRVACRTLYFDRSNYRKSGIRVRRGNCENLTMPGKMTMTAAATCEFGSFAPIARAVEEQPRRAVHRRRCALGACVSRPMHVVSASMSRRDLNFPTLGTPSSPAAYPALPSLSIASRLLDATALLSLRAPRLHYPPIGYMRVHLPAPSRTTRTRVYMYIRA